MTSCICFDRSGSNDIFHLKVQSTIFLRSRSRFLTETFASGMVEKFQVSSAKKFTLDEIPSGRSLIYIKKRTRVFLTGGSGFSK